jgi:hypothetical protein
MGIEDLNLNPYTAGLLARLSPGFYSLLVCYCNAWTVLSPNIMVERLTLLLHIWEVLAPNLGPDSSYPDLVFRGFPQSIQANAGIVP